MIRKTLTILSLIGLLLSVGLWGVSCRRRTYYWHSGDQHLIADPYWISLGVRPGRFSIHLERRLPWEPWSLNSKWSCSTTDGDHLNAHVLADHTTWTLCSQWHYQPDVPPPIIKLDTSVVYVSLQTGLEVTSGHTGRSTPPTLTAERQSGSLAVPYWLLGSLFAISLGVSSVPLYRQRRRRKRKKLGLCVKCGYDLRASKERCPECGEEFGSTIVEG